jgi:tight adherence protein C
VEQFSLGDWLNTDGIRSRLAMAGFRGPQAEIAFLFSRFVSPISFLLASTVGVFMFADPEMEALLKVGIVVASTFAGVKAPELYVRNVITKRQTEMSRAFPDGLDLMLICVESGMSIEHAFRKVSLEIGAQSTALAEEFALATAELSFLPDRRMAYANLAERTGLEGAKQVATVLVQAEKYGTALGRALRVAAQESRDARMMAAEQKAAALPPKLTVPMIIFFLPVLIAVVVGPAGIQIAGIM